LHAALLNRPPVGPYYRHRVRRAHRREAAPDLAEKAEECDRKALLAKRAELRNTFMDLAEQYRVLAGKVKASQNEHSSSAKLLVDSCPKQFASARDAFDARTVGEESIMADAVEALRQDMDEKAPNELVRR
jgi:Tfp pilus assembly protein PilE